jgi:hypothetical protein
MRRRATLVPPPRLSRPEIRRCVALALLGTLVVAGTMLALNWRIDHDVVTVIDPASESAAVPILRHDFPGYELHQGLGHDGQSFYAIARDPFHLADDAHYLDRPQYRLQRIALPVLGWMLHPQGDGRGLVVALWFWAVVGVALTGFGSALVARGLGASTDTAARLALFVPLLPAGWATLDLTVADELALGLAFLAIALDLYGRRRSAIALAVVAVLAKEVILLVFLGWAIWRGLATVLRLFAIPAAVALAWWITLHLTITTGHEAIGEFSPITGPIDSVRIWIEGYGRMVALVTIVTVVLAAVALWRRGVWSPLGPAIVLQLLLVACLDASVLSGDWNGTRAAAPLLVLAIIALVVPATRRLSGDTPEPVDASTPVAALPG